MIPWCECKVKKTSGYKHLGDQIWGCPQCLKPTQRFWYNQVLRKAFQAELDPIMERLLAGEDSDGLDKGRAEMAIKFIAMIENLSAPNLIHVRNESLKRISSK